MHMYLNALRFVKEHGEDVETRSGKVRSDIGMNMVFNLMKGFPAVTTKKLAFKSMIGELLWFMSGKTDLPSLRSYSNIAEGGNTIWTADYERWIKYLKDSPSKGQQLYGVQMESIESLGELYGFQWRSLGTGGDQLKKLIKNLKEDPQSRRLILQSYNPESAPYQALPACHCMVQYFVRYDELGNPMLDAIMYQRSADMFLGVPFNIASYAALQMILAKLTGMRARNLAIVLGDAHIYHDHFEAVDTQLARVPYTLPRLKMPEFNDLESLLKYTAKDFELVDYTHQGVIKAPLSVGG